MLPTIGKLKTERRWLRFTPDRLIGGLLVLEGLLLLSEHFRWFAFNQHKGWAVLIALASVGVAMLLMLLWFVASLLFRWRFQYSIRSLLVLTVAVAILCSWLAVQMKKAREQREAVEALEKLGGGVFYEYQFDGSGDLQLNAQPPRPTWLRSVLGDDFLTNVAGIYLTDIEATDAGLEHAIRFPQLKWLELKEALITDAGLEYLKGVPQLQTLIVCDTKVTDAGLKHLIGLTKLRTLFLMNTQVTDAGMVHLKALAQLQSLIISDTKVTDAGLEPLEGLVQLQWLDLSSTEVTDVGLEHLKGLAELQTLNLDYTNVTDAGLEHFTGLTKLQKLRFGGTKVTDAGLERLMNLTGLKYVNFHDTKVTDAGVKKLQQALPNCKIELEPPTPDKRQNPAVPAQPGG